MTTQSTYPKSMMFFHLFGLWAVLAAYGVISMTELFSRWSTSYSIVLQTHFLVGFLVLILVLPRLLIRVKKIKDIPEIVPALSRTNQLLARAGHIVIYIWMIVMPLLGWALVSARMGSVDVFGIRIPGIVAQSPDIAKFLKELHEIFGSIGIFLILGHGAMALWHHYKMQDTTLTRMFPWWKWWHKN